MYCHSSWLSCCGCACGGLFLFVLQRFCGVLLLCLAVCVLAALSFFESFLSGSYSTFYYCDLWRLASPPSFQPGLLVAACPPPPPPAPGRPAHKRPLRSFARRSEAPGRLLAEAEAPETPKEERQEPSAERDDEQKASKGKGKGTGRNRPVRVINVRIEIPSCKLMHWWRKGPLASGVAFAFVQQLLLH